MERATIEPERPSTDPPAEPGSGGLRRWLAADDAFGIPRKWLLAGGTAAILAALAAVLIGRQLVSDPTASTPPRTTTAAPKTPARPAQPLAPLPEGFMRVGDAAHGVSISLPKDWHRLPSPDAQVGVLATGDGASMLVRTAPLGVDVTPESIAQARKITDGLVRAAGEVKVLEGPKRVAVGDLPGYLYLYTYRDAATGRRGAHAHYFVFRHQTLVTIVFQVVPAERFAGLAPLFDQIGQTLRTSDVPVAPSLISPSS